MAVGGGVLSTCNYKARQFGVRSGMAGHIAKSKDPVFDGAVRVANTVRGVSAACICEAEFREVQWQSCRNPGDT
jgi:nucleotidyltransferase/DNA polymerase involved in DNA repair